MNDKALAFLNQSFLKPLLEQPEITDIAYNGERLFYQHNLFGRQASDVTISKEEAFDFMRQIANLTEQLFSYSSPILDVSVGPYRVNAVHPAIGRKKYDRAVTFSIRIGRFRSIALEQDQTFLPEEAREILFQILTCDKSIVIAGKTGSGKTELQKYLLTNLASNSRVIVVDNVQELEEISDKNTLDLTLWQMNPNVAEASFGDLIRNALRSNPDWLIVAEARGKEMMDVLNAAMTGHPVITTLHSLDIHSMPSRMARMVLMADENLKYDQVLLDIRTHFPYLVFLQRLMVKGQISRFVEAIAEVQEDGTLKMLFQNRHNASNPVEDENAL